MHHHAKEHPSISKRLSQNNETGNYKLVVFFFFELFFYCCFICKTKTIIS